LKSFFVYAGTAAAVGILAAVPATAAHAAPTDGPTYVRFLGFFDPSLPWSGTCTVKVGAPGHTVQTTLADSMRKCAPSSIDARSPRGSPSDGTHHDSMLVYIPADGNSAPQARFPRVAETTA
jgi:hypothetical protein